MKQINTPDGVTYELEEIESGGHTVYLARLDGQVVMEVHRNDEPPVLYPWRTVTANDDRAIEQFGKTLKQVTLMWHGQQLVQEYVNAKDRDTIADLRHKMEIVSKAIGTV